MNTVNPSFWAGRKVFVTGHTGFKGSWLCLWLQRLGAEVLGYSLPPPSHPSLFELARVGKGMTTITADIADLDRLQRAVAEFRPEVVLHLAAQSLVRKSYQVPVETFRTNVMGTVHLLEAVRVTGDARAVVVVTSDKCYENQEWVWAYRETCPLGGADPYSASKGAAEIVASAYARSFFSAAAAAPGRTAVASARAGNVIGGGDWAEDRLVPDIVRALLANKPLILRKPNATRPWQHVLEPLHGYLLLAERLCTEGAKWSGGWNFGPDESGERTVGWIADELQKLWGATGWHQDPTPPLHEATLLKVDSAKARALLGWRPKTSVRDALRRIVDWTKAYEVGRDLREVTLVEIQDFMKLPPPD